ncbi:Gag protein [Danaus plexippus plexippus]|uniref:Gag protein n=1 Tax=Danaus plexippus plexippus TaxID=278856 RepID=A0A212FPT9_DANPL|nr:Gag protein [Danaus plexippus plexippus]
MTTSGFNRTVTSASSTADEARDQKIFTSSIMDSKHIDYLRLIKFIQEYDPELLEKFYSSRSNLPEAKSPVSPPSTVESLKPDSAPTQCVNTKDTIQTDGSSTLPKNPSTQVLSVVIRSFPVELSEQIVLKELKSNFLPVKSAHRMYRASTSTPFDCVLVFLDFSCEGNKIFNVKTVCYLSVVIELARYPKKCSRCNLYGHREQTQTIKEMSYLVTPNCLGVDQPIEENEPQPGPCGMSRHSELNTSTANEDN